MRFLWTIEEEEGDTVTVIGGCGFLGQHLLKLLHTHASNISLIKVMDFSPFKSRLDYQPIREVQSIIGTVTCMEDLLVATAGATTVFHLASFTDRHMFPDYQLLHETNVEGTQNVIRACQKNGVRNLIYASDISVVMGQPSIVHGKESSLPYPRYHLLPDGPTKAMAEKMILDANGTPKRDPAESDSDTSLGPQLKTLALRLVNLYGELDSFLWPRLVELGAFNHGYVPCVGSLKSKVHLMYAGNAAWALVRAHETLCSFTGSNMDPVQQDAKGCPSTNSSIPSTASETTEVRGILAINWDSLKRTTKQKWADFKSQPEESVAEFSQSEASINMGPQDFPPGPQISVEGKVFFVCDDTPPINYFTFMKSFLRRYGFFLTSWTLPERWARSLAKVVFVVLWVLYPFIHINPPVSKGEIRQLCRHYFFSSRLARTELRYSPLYSLKESLQNTVDFYDREYKQALSMCLYHEALGSQHVSNARRLSQVKKDIISADLGDTGKRYRGKYTQQDIWLRGMMTKQR